MNVSELQRKLIVAARANTPTDSVPYAFEKRIAARLAGRPELDLLGPWEHGLSRAAVFCVALMVVLATGSFFIAAPAPSAVSDTFSQDMQTALLASVDNGPADGTAAESP